MRASDRSSDRRRETSEKECQGTREFAARDGDRQSCVAVYVSRKNYKKRFAPSISASVGGRQRERKEGKKGDR